MKKKKEVDQEPDEERSGMNLPEIKELIELVSEKGFTEFEVARKGFRLRMSRFKEPAAASALPSTPPVVPVIISTPQGEPVAQQPPAGQRDTFPPTAPDAAPATREAGAETAPPDVQLHTIKSPIVGTFYRSPSPSSEPFVKIGDQVEQDSVVCIIEAMKLMNEIQAEVSGEVVKIYVENGQPVEYGQPLFGIKS
jgi:acetyl-CoA carboxylase biotin carboxyl carrier protein